MEPNWSQILILNGAKKELQLNNVSNEKRIIKNLVILFLLLIFSNKLTYPATGACKYSSGWSGVATLLQQIKLEGYRKGGIYNE